MSIPAEEVGASEPVKEPPAGLLEDTKQTIREALSRMSATPGFRSRAAQRLMIAEVSKTLAGEYPGERVVSIEGPTGTGKSLGYLLSAIPVAQARGKTLVIATATVALQEQLVTKDLPDLHARAGLEFSFTLAKGRRRYVCDRNLEPLAGANEDQGLLDFGDGEQGQGTWAIKPAEGETDEVEAMWASRSNGNWSGDLDEWPNSLRQELRDEITTDKASCTGASCRYRWRCAFFKARAENEKKDVVVANHALVMSDLMLGGGVVLPAPKNTIYVFDEGHHLPSVAVEQGAAKARLAAAKQTLSELAKLPGKAAPALAGQTELVSGVKELGTELAGEARALVRSLDDTYRALENVHPAMSEPQARKGRGGRYARGSREPDMTWRFPMGEVPADLCDLFEQARVATGAVHSLARRLGDRLKKGAENDPNNRGITTLQASAQRLVSRIDTMETAFAQLAAAPSDNPADPPVARWIEVVADGGDFECCASPTSAAGLLRSLLWSQCDGAVVTSATLAALGRFDRFYEQAGLHERHGNRAIKLDSPFDYANRAELVVPNIVADPKDHDRHSDEIAARCNAGLIAPGTGTLVLFASYRQMRAVLKALKPELAAKVLMQGEAPRHELLEKHRQRIEAGQGSILFGVASFSEGVDLPGEQCTHVIVAKLPFAVPDSPVEATLSEWLESRGRNPFMELSVPDASFKLIQSAGRLLRTETDYGRVTVLDRRFADRPYGRAMMNALPPFRRFIEGRGGFHG